MKKSRSLRPSNSSGNLVDNRYYLSDDQDMTRDRKGLVKRTKSFWKFGKNSSDNEILEGMALWRHRDLVDVEEKEAQKKHFNSQQRIRRPSRDKSNDSDKTLNAKQIEENQTDVKEKPKPVPEVRRRRISTNEKQKLSLPPRRESDEEYHFEKSKNENVDDQFYDDGDDRLIMRTVNRKNILQQYSNDSTGPDSDSESEIISDDPYDCIVVDDQKVKKNTEFPNVAAIGKKLEKLSKSAKYPPGKSSNIHNNQIYNSIADKNNVNLKNEKNNAEKRNNSESENSNLIHYREQRHSFKTFGIEIQNDENGEKESGEGDRFYHNKRNNEPNSQERRRYYNDTHEHNNIASDRRGRSGYETIDDHQESRKPSNNRRNNSERSKREMAADELSDVIENKQFLPRTKLTKTNSNNSKSMYEDDGDMMDYGETLQRRMKSQDHGSKFNEKSANSGNMYGPWYDLWGLDASVRK